MITSLQNERVKLVYGLQNRPRTRRKERKIVLEGLRLVRDAIMQAVRPAFVMYEARTVDYELLAQLQTMDVTLIEISEEILMHLSDTQQPQGIIAVFPMPVPELPRTHKRILILDNVRDPGNMGTILRSAAAAGINLVMLSPGCVDPYNPKVLRGGMGAHFRVPVIEVQWHEIEGYCEGIGIYVMTGTGSTRYDQVDWRDNYAVIVGSEAHGAGSRALGLATAQVYIPMAAETESLNAAVATAVVLFEAARQNLTEPPETL